MCLIRRENTAEIHEKKNFFVILYSSPATSFVLVQLTVQRS